MGLLFLYGIQLLYSTVTERIIINTAAERIKIFFENYVRIREGVWVHTPSRKKKVCK
jgi:hypothetical protein